MHLMTSLLLLIVVARLLGQIFKKFNQPVIVGEMLAGVILGPSILSFIQPSQSLSGISELAVFLVVLSAGLEMNFKDVVGVYKGKGMVIALLGFFLPFFSGATVAHYFNYDLMRIIFLGLCVSITALPIAVGILQSFNLINSDIAKYSIATAVFNDVLALMILGVILNLPANNSTSDVGWSIFNISWKLIVLCSIVLAFNYFSQRMIQRGIHLDKISEKIVKLLGNEALFGILVLFVLVFGSISETLGFHFVIGAFFGSLLIDKKFFLASRFDELERTLKSITGGFLAPVFFAYLGLSFNIDSLKSVGFVTAVLAVSIFSKILSGWMGGRMIGLSNNTSLGIGVILNGRGVMELVIASIAYERGFINQGLFTTLVLMGVVTTMITPILFNKFVSIKDAQREAS